MTEDTSKWESVVSDKNIHCYKRPVEGASSMVVKCVSEIDGFSSEEIFNAIYDLKLRMSWDKVFREFKVVREAEYKENMELPEILYMSLESPVFFIKNRDWVQQRKAWKKTPNDNTFILHFKSVELDDVPETDKCVRAHTYISGYFVTKISENKSLLIIIAMNDIKGSIPKWLVNRESAKAPKKWVENLKKGMEIIRSNNKKKK